MKKNSVFVQFEFYFNLKNLQATVRCNHGNRQSIKLIMGVLDSWCQLSSNYDG